MQRTKLNEIFEVNESVKRSPRFKNLTEDTYRQLESGIYDVWGRRKNIDVKKYDEDGHCIGYKDFSHLKEITITRSHFEYLNLLWLFIDQRQTKQFKYICKETYIFDTLCLVIQELHHDFVMAKILVKDEDEELRIHIEDILEYKPIGPVPARELHEINELEYHGMKFNSSVEKVDKQGLIITNIDHFDNYVYEIYDSIRHSYKHLNKESQRRAVEAQTIWLENWIDKKELSNDIESLMPFMTQEVIETLNKYTYQNEDYFDRKSCGSHLFEDVTYEVYSLDTLSFEETKGKRMERICQELDIPLSAGWDIWKILNKRKMNTIVKELYEEFPI